MQQLSASQLTYFETILLSPYYIIIHFWNTLNPTTFLP